MPDRISWSRGWRGIVLIIIGVVMGANLIAPAVAHVGGTINHLWSAPGHIRAKADARYVKKTDLRAVGKRRDFDTAGAISMAAGGTHTAKLLEITVPAPAAGFIYVDHWMSFYGGGSDDSGLTWTELDQATDCSSTGGQFPANKVPGSRTLFEMGADFYETAAGSLVLPVASGTHSVTLCATAVFGSVNAVDGALNAFWVRSGSSALIQTPGATAASASRKAPIGRG